MPKRTEENSNWSRLSEPTVLVSILCSHVALGEYESNEDFKFPHKMVFDIVLILSDVSPFGAAM